MNITKYNIYNPLNVTIPTKKRKFMDDSWNGFAYRCLPMTVANGFGWTVLNSHRFTVKWNGGIHIPDTVILYDKMPDVLWTNYFLREQRRHVCFKRFWKNQLLIDVCSHRVFC